MHTHLLPPFPFNKTHFIGSHLRSSICLSSQMAGTVSALLQWASLHVPSAINVNIAMASSDLAAASMLEPADVAFLEHVSHGRVAALFSGPSAGPAADLVLFAAKHVAVCKEAWAVSE